MLFQHHQAPSSPLDKSEARSQLLAPAHRISSLAAGMLPVDLPSLSSFGATGAIMIAAAAYSLSLCPDHQHLGLGEDHECVLRGSYCCLRWSVDGHRGDFTAAHETITTLELAMSS